MPKKAVTVQSNYGDVVRRIRQRLSSSDKPVTQERLSNVLGVSWSTVARWEGGQNPDPDMGQKLLRLEEVIALVGDLIHPDDRVLFFERPHPLLLGMKPIDLLDTEEGTRALKKVVEGVRTGAFQ